MKYLECLKSWKTTAVGVIAGLILILPQIKALIDNDPATICDWNIVMAGVGAIIFGSVAKDGDKSGVPKE